MATGSLQSGFLPASANIHGEGGPEGTCRHREGWGARGGTEGQRLSREAFVLIGAELPGYGQSTVAFTSPIPETEQQGPEDMVTLGSKGQHELRL